MQWTTSYNESVLTYANTINTHEGGTHEEGFRAALTTLVNKYAREKGILKEKDDNLSGDDVREGLTAVISVKLVRAAVRGPDQDQARQHRGEGVRAEGRRRAARRLVRPQPQPGARHHPQGDPGGAGAHRRPQGARDDPAQGPARGRRHARQAQGLPVEGPVALRDLHRRGRLGRRLRRAGPQPRDPGDPPAARQDPQRREGAARPRARQQRGAGDDHGVRRRHRRGLQPREGPVPQDRADGRCRCRRPAHHDAAAHPAVPLHAPAHRARLRVPRAAAALPPQVVERRARVRLQRPRARRAPRRRASRRASASRRTTASSATRVSARWTTRSCGRPR